MNLACVISACALLCACKDTEPAKAPTPLPTSPSPSEVTAKPTAERPSLPTPAPKPMGEPLSIEDAQKALPELDGKQILPLKQTSDKRQVHATWCMDGDAADDVARRVGRQMAEGGYKDLSIRGDAKKAGVQGDRDGFRMSMVVSASSAASCPAPKHYFASATIFRP